ncbi:hypothetical protein QNI19_26740 [Cytophagaceae bacterium DM2B3-1]|uniref:Uncharacterized protein n=1 Tax=Xanthocytophaga flava TaxID=3048013 RepID=A0ABT7CS32_9BACT|nr:hypothetical protein [Xanthocytophaga flavus]MDJ1496559.1 hypothetical protein [Xanthocytophaga flavus]
MSTIIIVLMSLSIIGYWIKTAKLYGQVRELKKDNQHKASLVKESKKKIDQCLEYLSEFVRDEDSREDQIKELGKELEELGKRIEHMEAMAKHNLPTIIPTDN